MWQNQQSNRPKLQRRIGGFDQGAVQVLTAVQHNNALNRIAKMLRILSTG